MQSVFRRLQATKHIFFQVRGYSTKYCAKVAHSNHASLLTEAIRAKVYDVMGVGVAAVTMDDEEIVTEDDCT